MAQRTSGRLRRRSDLPLGAGPAVVLLGVLLALLPACARELKVLAIRVDFQPDTLATTTGDGRFESAFQFEEPWAVDPLPHDSLYFDSHLRFLDHYWRKASGDSLTLDWEIWPAGAQAAYRVEHPIWHYNWNQSDERTDEQLAEFFRDAWTAADADPALRFFDDAGQPRFDAYIIFHAGVGQDFGEDSTPHDLPSAYLAPEPGQATAAHQVELSDGAAGPRLTLQRGLILPEGENHKDFQHGLAGLIVLQFGHQLGLPNLYESSDGGSVIGKWGLMDQGSANFAALLPAPPEAWSRSWLGWTTPRILSQPRDSVLVAAPGFGAGLPQVVKIPLTHKADGQNEFLLVEARLRTLGDEEWTWGRDRDGRWARLEEDGDVVFQDTLGVAGDSAGVLVEVGRLDFGLPGSGLLVWHVDERSTTAQAVAANSVNDDPARRGVDLEEGDGVQDIGRSYGLFSARSGVALGGNEDPWQTPNTGWTLANQHVLAGGVAFAWNTEPSTCTNDGLFTGLRLDQISAPDSVMQFRLSWDQRPAFHGAPLCPPLGGDTLSAARTMGFEWQVDGATTDSWLCLLDGAGRCYGRALSGALEAWIRPDGHPSPLPASWQDGLDGLWEWNSAGQRALVAQRGDSLALFLPSGDPARFRWTAGWRAADELRAVLVCGGGAGAWADRPWRLFVQDGALLRELALPDFALERVVDNEPGAGEIQLVDLEDGGSLPGWRVNGSEGVRIGLSGVAVEVPAGGSWPLDAELLALAPDSLAQRPLIDSVGVATALVRSSQGVWWFRGAQPLGSLQRGNRGARPIQFGPDAGLELALSLEDRCVVVNQAGVELAELPLPAAAGLPLTGSRTDENGLALLAGAPDRLQGVDGGARIPADWPRVWTGGVDGPLHLPGIALTVGVDPTGAIQAWEGGLADAVWTQPRGWNGGRRPWGTGTVHEQAVRAVRENPAYIWPSPATDVAHVHFLLAGAARVVFRAYDAAGDRVAKLEGHFQGPGEQELVWRLDDVAPGVYFGTLEAEGTADHWTRRLTCAVIR